MTQVLPARILAEASSRASRCTLDQRSNGQLGCRPQRASRSGRSRLRAARSVVATSDSILRWSRAQARRPDLGHPDQPLHPVVRAGDGTGRGLRPVGRGRGPAPADLHQAGERDRAKVIVLDRGGDLLTSYRIACPDQRLGQVGEHLHLLAGVGERGGQPLPLPHRVRGAVALVEVGPRLGALRLHQCLKYGSVTASAALSASSAASRAPSGSNSAPTHAGQNTISTRAAAVSSDQATCSAAAMSPAEARASTSWDRSASGGIGDVGGVAGGQLRLSGPCAGCRQQEQPLVAVVGIIQRPGPLRLLRLHERQCVLHDQGHVNGSACLGVCRGLGSFHRLLGPVRLARRDQGLGQGGQHLRPHRHDVLRKPGIQVGRLLRPPGQQASTFRLACGGEFPRRDARHVFTCGPARLGARPEGGRSRKPASTSASRMPGSSALCSRRTATAASMMASLMACSSSSTTSGCARHHSPGDHPPPPTHPLTTVESLAPSSALGTLQGLRRFLPLGRASSSMPPLLERDAALRRLEQR